MARAAVQPNSAALTSSSSQHRAVAQTTSPGYSEQRATEPYPVSVQVCLGSKHLWSVGCLLLNKSLVSSLLAAASVYQTIYCIQAISILMVHNRRERHTENTQRNDKC